MSGGLKFGTTLAMPEGTEGMTWTDLTVMGTRTGITTLSPPSVRSEESTGDRWWERAACYGVNDLPWIAEGRGRPRHEAVEEMTAYCDSCSVRDECKADEHPIVDIPGGFRAGRYSTIKKRVDERRQDES